MSENQISKEWGDEAYAFHQKAQIDHCCGVLLEALKGLSKAGYNDGILTCTTSRLLGLIISTYPEDVRGQLLQLSSQITGEFAKAKDFKINGESQ